jgi:hypothetical protein
VAGDGSDLFIQYHAPESLGIGSFEMTVPRFGQGTGTEALVRNVARNMSEIYDVPFDRVAHILSTGSTIVSIGLEGEEVRYGSVPLTKFEAVIERFKKSLLDTAAFVITDDAVIG